MSLQTPEILGDGVSLSYSTDGTTYTPFAKIEDVTGFKVKSPEIKTTILGDTVEKSQPGTPDYGEGSITIIYDKSIISTILGWMNSKAILSFKIIVTDSTTTQSNGVVQGWVMEYDPIGTSKKNDKIVQKIQIRATGALTWTAGS